MQSTSSVNKPRKLGKKKSVYSQKVTLLKTGNDWDLDLDLSNYEEPAQMDVMVK